MREPPNDRRNFVHKRILRAAGSFITGGPLAAATSLVGPSPRAQPRRAALGPTADSAGGCGHAGPGMTAFGPGQPCLPTGGSSLAATARSFGVNIELPCIWPTQRDPVSGKCKVFVGEQPGREPGGVGGGQVQMGQFGAAMVPDVDMVETLNCLPGMILGKDSMCYNKRDLTNRERKWPRGRRPLLTGGDRNAITRAARAARAIQRTEKQLQKMGMLRKPTARRAAPRARQITSGEVTRIVNVD